jgi:hypothetical protein
MVSPWGLNGMSAIAEVERCRTVVALKKDEVQRYEESAVIERRMRRAQRISTLSSWLQLRESWHKLPPILGYFLARFRGFGGYEHRSWADKRWMTSQYWLFENLDCSRKLCFYFYNLSDRKWVDAKRSSSLVARDQVDTDYQNRLLRRKGRLVTEFRNFLYGR